MTSKVKILSIDPALTGTGFFAEMEDGTHFSHYMKTDATKELWFRIMEIRKIIYDCDPEIIILENLIWTSQKQAYMYCYLLINFQAQFKIVISYQPRKWQWVHNYYHAIGNTTKERSLYVCNKLGIKVNTHDEADAACMLAYYKLGKMGIVPNYNEELILEDLNMRADQTKKWSAERKESQEWVIYDKVQEAFFNENLDGYTFKKAEMHRLLTNQIDNFCEHLKNNGYLVTKIKVGKVPEFIRKNNLK